MWIQNTAYSTGNISIPVPEHNLEILYCANVRNIWVSLEKNKLKELGRTTFSPTFLVFDFKCSWVFQGSLVPMVLPLHVYGYSFGSFSLFLSMRLEVSWIFDFCPWESRTHQVLTVNLLFYTRSFIPVSMYPVLLTWFPSAHVPENLLFVCTIFVTRILTVFLLPICSVLPMMIRCS
jgi:hypothetical protein